MNLIVKTPTPPSDVIVTLGGGGTFPQLYLHVTMGVGMPTASHLRVTVSPSNASTRRGGREMTTGAAEKIY